MKMGKLENWRKYTFPTHSRLQKSLTPANIVLKNYKFNKFTKARFRSVISFQLYLNIFKFDTLFL